MTRPVAVFVCSISLSFLTTARADTVYNNIPANLSTDLSWPYEAELTSEFGGLIQLSSSDTSDYTVTVEISNWAMESSWEPVGTSSGFTLPLTLNLYQPGSNVNVNGWDTITVGSLISTETVDALIPWRPEAKPTACTADPTQYLGTDGQCHSGTLSAVSFTFSDVNLPSQLVWGLAFNTKDAGNNPTGTDGPYDALNISLTTSSPLRTAFIPMEVQPLVFRKTSVGARMAAVRSTFRQRQSPRR